MELASKTIRADTLTLPGHFFRTTIIWFSTAALGLAICPDSFAGDHPKNARDIKAQVLYCHDGDTCRVKVPGNFDVTVRLACMDAPELSRGKTAGQPFAESSRELLNHLVRGREVELNMVDIDHYRRPIVFIRTGETTVNHVLLEKGLAEVYRGRTPYSRRECYKRELTAKRKKTGIWSIRNYESPGIFRKRFR